MLAVCIVEKRKRKRLWLLGIDPEEHREKYKKVVVPAPGTVQTGNVASGTVSKPGIVVAGPDQLVDSTRALDHYKVENENGVESESENTSQVLTPEI